MGGNVRIDFKRILCPTDLSPESDEVLRYAIDLALAYEAKLFVCHCVGSSPPADESRLERNFLAQLLGSGDRAIAQVKTIETTAVWTASSIQLLMSRGLAQIALRSSRGGCGHKDCVFRNRYRQIII